MPMCVSVRESVCTSTLLRGGQVSAVWSQRTLGSMHLFSAYTEHKQNRAARPLALSVNTQYSTLILSDSLHKKTDFI